MAIDNQHCCFACLLFSHPAPPLFFFFFSLLPFLRGCSSHLHSLEKLALILSAGLTWHAARFCQPSCPPPPPLHTHILVSGYTCGLILESLEIGFFVSCHLSHPHFAPKLDAMFVFLPGKSYLSSICNHPGKVLCKCLFVFVFSKCFSVNTKHSG